MARALRLAARGLFSTQPNPRVGCVIARGEDVLGEGWHVRAGGPHAEVHALRAAGESARGATAYVTLEPCGLHGRTPPCADALIAAGVARVVIACEDAFQREGGAVERMRAAGIEVVSGLMREQARELNIGFFSRVERARPFLRLKLAASLDGRIALASGESKWITGEAARADVQRWRARASAILTGSGTALADDPRLTVRLADAESVPPLRVLLDRELRLPRSANLLADDAAPTLVFHAERIAAPADCAPFVQHLGVAEGDHGLDLAAVLAELARRGVNELLVECGPRLSGALVRGGFVDELLLYQAPLLLGGDAQPMLDALGLQRLDQHARWRVIERRQVGVDQRLRLRPGEAP
ncbi:bifunctional diaminohydroxyphosphoribosylaminopyrimidine deaminase/5-amino-6-(5-phosphoribosylamino)uracil reductase RibD [Aquimonas voraii]|nr:bifunctional diaminohydroxyphosphoribosylaminopyrimidine deaminase/5-amino-6-(5-phosphoribosylamino)uracil reductase RibD [Aquimonas voraii]